jgi:succinoglycan biosynthesis protein ExoM
MARVAVGICSYRRPEGLRRLLKSLEMLATAESVRVIVADNDPDRRQALTVCRALNREGYRWPLDAFVVSNRGLPHARNAVIEVGFSDPSTEFVALLDDDEHVESRWLQAMLDMQALTDADIVGGAVVPEFEKKPSAWMLGAKAAFRRDETTDGLVDELYGDGNTLFARKIMRLVLLPFFDPAFSFTGGHDSYFFQQAKRKGAKFARASRARAFETYPITRMTIRWVLMRNYRSGANHIEIKKRLERSPINWLIEIAKMAVAPFVFPIEFCLFVLSPSRRVDALSRLLRAFGKLGGFLGHRYEEYLDVHGH